MNKTIAQQPHPDFDFSLFDTSWEEWNQCLLLSSGNQGIQETGTAQNAHPTHPTPPPIPRVTSKGNNAGKRTIHNRIEERYRGSINDPIVLLRELLFPLEAPTGKPKKSLVLTQAVREIRELRSQVKILKAAAEKPSN